MANTYSDFEQAKNDIRINIGRVGNDQTNPIFLKALKGEPLTHEEMDGNFAALFVLAGKLIRAGIFDFSALAEKMQALDDGEYLSVGDADSSVNVSWENIAMHIYQEVFNSDKEGSVYIVKNMERAIVGQAAIVSDVSAIDSAGLFDGKRVFDVATKKTLTFYGQALYDTMGNIVRDFTSNQ